MSKARLQMAMRHVALGEQLVDDQRQRVADFQERGSHESWLRATELLQIFENNLALRRVNLARLRSKFGLDAEP